MAKEKHILLPGPLPTKDLCLPVSGLITVLVEQNPGRIGTLCLVDACCMADSGGVSSTLSWNSAVWPVPYFNRRFPVSWGK